MHIYIYFHVSMHIYLSKTMSSHQYFQLQPYITGFIFAFPFSYLQLPLVTMSGSRYLNVLHICSIPLYVTIVLAALGQFLVLQFHWFPPVTSKVDPFPLIPAGRVGAKA